MADVAAQPSTTAKPEPLTTSEKLLAALLMVAGAVLTYYVLDVLLTDGKWLIEESTTTGDGAEKAVETRKYSDTLPLAGVGVGGLLILCGAFFGRLREITLPGGAGIKLGDVKDQLEEKVEQKVEETAQRQALSADQVQMLTEEAKRQAKATLFDQVSAGSSPAALDEGQLDRVAARALDTAARRAF